MELTSAFFLGICLKLVDEVLDKDIYLQPLFLELFKCLTILCLVIPSLHDFPFALSTSLSLGLSYVAGGIDHDYWWAFLGCSFLLTILSFRSDYLTPWLFPVVWIMPLIVYGEALVFPENSSFEKMLGSAAMIPLLVFLYKLPIVPYLKAKIPLSGLAEKGVLFGIGYFFTRTLVKGYINYQTQTTASQPIVLTKETKNTETLSKPPSVLDSPPLNDEHTHASDSDNVLLKLSEAQ
jgi:hypothetical protein